MKARIDWRFKRGDTFLWVLVKRGRDFSVIEEADGSWTVTETVPRPLAEVDDEKELYRGDDFPAELILKKFNLDRSEFKKD